MKSLSKHITESFKSGHVFIEDVLDKIEPTIDKMVDEAAKSYEIKFEREFTEWDRKYTKSIIVSDLVKSFAKYVKSNDELGDFSVSGSPSGQITIQCMITRQGQSYQYSTKVIYAGGYNIQRLHYRYVTSTTLPADGDSSVAKIYSEKVKSLSKAEKLNNELNRYIQRKEQLLEKINQRQQMSDEEILKTSAIYMYLVMPFKDVNVDSHIYKEYVNDVAAYDAMRAKDRAENIDRFKRQTELTKQDLASINSQIKKLEAKLAAIN